MTDSEVRDIILNALADVAPEIDTDTLDASMSLRNGADLDSMDYLAYVSGVSEAIEADIPEDDYDQLDTVDAAVEYVRKRLSA